MRGGAGSRVRALLPKEHGAYGQLAFPAVTACASSGVTAATLLLIGAIVGGFLAHEPILILSGRRGERVRVAQRAFALPWLVSLIALTVLAGGAALILMPAPLRWSVAAPVVPAARRHGGLFRGHAEDEPQSDPRIYSHRLPAIAQPTDD